MEPRKKREVLEPPFGVLSFRSEASGDGNEDTRRLRIHYGRACVAVGRCYFFSTVTKAQAYADLIAIGVDRTYADAVSEAAGLRSGDAYSFDVHGLEDFRITDEQQVRLFAVAYQRAEAELREELAEIAETRNVLSFDWNALHPAVKDVAVDIKIAGDFTGKARGILAGALFGKDPVMAVAELLGSIPLWERVGRERFGARIRHLAEAVNAKRRHEDEGREHVRV
jgi:hypothetical protein